MLGEKVRGFDRDFLRALAGAAANGKVVLGEVLGGDQPVRPSPGQRVAVRQQQNIRPLNVHIDSDDIVRRLPLSFTVNGAKVPRWRSNWRRGRSAPRPNSMSAAG